MVVEWAREDLINSPQLFGWTPTSGATPSS